MQETRIPEFGRFSRARIVFGYHAVDAERIKEDLAELLDGALRRREQAGDRRRRALVPAAR